MIAGDTAARLRIMTTTAGPISLSATTARTGSTTTTTTAHSLTWLKKPVCNWATGLQVQRGATMTVMGYWICMLRVMFTSIARTCRSAEPRRWDVRRQQLLVWVCAQRRRPRDRLDGHCRGGL